MISNTPAELIRNHRMNGLGDERPKTRAHIWGFNLLDNPINGLAVGATGILSQKNNSNSAFVIAALGGLPIMAATVGGKLIGSPLSTRSTGTLASDTAWSAYGITVQVKVAQTDQFSGPLPWGGLVGPDGGWGYLETPIIVGAGCTFQCTFAATNLTGATAATFVGSLMFMGKMIDDGP